MIEQKNFLQEKQKADAGDRVAQYNVAKHYLSAKKPGHYYWCDESEFKKYIEKSAEQRYAPAQRDYAQFLLDENQGEYNVVKAAEYYFQLALAENEVFIKVLHEQGELYKKLNKIAERSSSWCSYTPPSAQARAAYLLGNLHYDDKFRQKNIEKAINFYKMAPKNYSLAANKLGDIYYSGNGVAKDLRSSFNYFNEICNSSCGDGGNGYSYYMLGQHYHFGHGVEKSIEKAITAYERSYNKGYSAAAMQLGYIYREKVKEEKEKQKNGYSYCLEEYKRKAIEYYRKNEKVEDLQYYIGLVYDDAGEYPEALEWFTKAAEQGLAVAKYKAALIYEFHLKDSGTAIQWYKQAAANGCADAQYQLALKYEKGDSVPKDYITAFRWCLMAETNKNKDAQNLLTQKDRFFYRYKELYDELNEQENEAAVNIFTQMEKYIALEQSLGYEFSEPYYLFKALDRELNEKTQEPYFQPYEFLGDAILTAVIRQYIVDNAPDAMKRGKMAKICDALVANDAVLPKVAKKLRLSEFINKAEVEAKHDITDQMLADHMEALIGAIMKDGNFEETEEVVINFWQPYLDEALAERPMTQILDKGTQAATEQLSSVEGKSLHLSPRSQNLFHCCPLQQYEKYIKAARDIDVKNVGKEGNTPLMTFLIKSKREEAEFINKQLPIIEALYKARASLDKPNNKGKTARKLIEEHSQKKLIKSRLGL